jgi:hypothetical protein
VLPGYDHACCWEQNWKAHLQRFQQGRQMRRPTTKPIIHREE